MTSPASTKITSPTTISEDLISSFCPSLFTLTMGDDSSLRLSNDFSAFTYCTVPNIAFIIRTTIITIVLSTLPETAEIIAATTNMATNKSKYAFLMCLL